MPATIIFYGRQQFCLQPLNRDEFESKFNGRFGIRVFDSLDPFGEIIGLSLFIRVHHCAELEPWCELSSSRGLSSLFKDRDA